MINKILIPDSELKKYYMDESLPEKMRALLIQQKETWKELKKNYDDLKSVKTKQFDLDNTEVKAQFNPKRIKSTTAEIDKKTIGSRESFLKIENLPKEQRGLQFNKHFIILCNPYPIFPEHFTISTIKQSPQLIHNNFSTLLELSKELGTYFTAIYNGPECGASAPDHMHFQAGSKNFMPLETEYTGLLKSHGVELFKSKVIKITGVDLPGRKFFTFDSHNESALKESFNIFMEVLGKAFPSKIEPKINIISSFDKEGWRIIIFPRLKHRPSYYYSEGKDKLLVSPAAIDMGGVLTLPVEKDFKKINSELIRDIYRQVSISLEYFEYLKIRLWERYNSPDKFKFS